MDMKAFIFIVATLFGVIALGMLMNIILNQHLSPILKDNLPSGDLGTDAGDGIDFISATLTYVPYILFGGVLVTFLIFSFRREPTEREF